MVIISTINLRFIFEDQFRTFSTITLYFVTWNWVLTFPLKIVHFLRWLWLWLWLWLIFRSFFLLDRLLILSIQIRIIFLDYHLLNSVGFNTRVVLFVVFPNSCSNFKLVHHTIFDVKCFLLVWHRLIIGVLIYVSGVICVEVVIVNIVVLRVWIVNVFNEWIDTLADLLLTFVKTLEPQLILCALADCQRNIAAQRFNCTHIGRINNNPPRFTEFQLVAT